MKKIAMAVVVWVLTVGMALAQSATLSAGDGQAGSSQASANPSSSASASASSSATRAENVSEPLSLLHEGSSEYDVYVALGNGVGKRSSTHYFYPAFRWGRVMTGEHLPGKLRGNMEYVIDIIPYIAFFQEGPNAQGGGFTPFMLKWNFTSGKHLVPYFEAGGGAIFTTHDVPQNTNSVNFTPQGGFGVHIPRGNRHAVTMAGEYMHVSNASLSHRNSGINASFRFSIGYTWFR